MHTLIGKGKQFLTAMLMQLCVPQVQALQQKAKEENCEVVVVSAQVRFLPIFQVLFV